MATASLSYRDYFGSRSLSSTSFTKTVNLGTEYTARRVYLFGQLCATDSLEMTSASLTVTVNGVTATCLDARFGGGANYQTWVAAVPTGTSVTVSVSHASRTFVQAFLGIYTYNPTSTTLVDSGGDIANVSSPDHRIDDLEAVANGVLLCFLDGSWVYAQGLQDFGTQAWIKDYTFSSDARGYHLIPSSSSTTNDVLVADGGYSPTAVLYAVSLAADALITEFPVSATDGIGVGESTARRWSLGVGLTDTANVVEVTAYIAGANLKYDTLTDGFGVGQTDALNFTYAPLVFDYVRMRDPAGYRDTISAEDNFDVYDTPTSGYGMPVVEGVGIGGVVPVYAFRPGAVVVEGVEARDVIIRNVSYRQTEQQGISARDTLTLALPAYYTDSAAITVSIMAVRGIRVMESLGIADVILPKTFFGITSTDRIGLTDGLLRFFAGDAMDGIGMQDVMANQKKASGALADTLGLSDDLTRKFVIRLVAKDDVNIDDVQVLKMIYGPTLVEGVEIAAAYISPNGSVTTWAVNTKNMAVTEYSNYNFNSFAKLGNKYLGASSSGLYELNGDTDDTTDIVAEIKSGLMQLGGSRFSSLKAAYLGMRGEGDFVLKVETGDGKVYNYAVIGKDLQTSRVHFGKGLRARYFAFELISTGQDFDLDTVEFIPLVAQRRV